MQEDDFEKLKESLKQAIRMERTHATVGTECWCCPTVTWVEGTQTRIITHRDVTKPPQGDEN